MPSHLNGMCDTITWPRLCLDGADDGKKVGQHAPRRDAADGDGEGGETTRGNKGSQQLPTSSNQHRRQVKL